MYLGEHFKVETGKFPRGYLFIFSMEIHSFHFLLVIEQILYFIVGNWK